jgi:hypothetical protein
LFVAVVLAKQSIPLEACASVPPNGHPNRSAPTRNLNMASMDKWVDWTKTTRSKNYRGSNSFATFMIIGRM